MLFSLSLSRSGSNTEKRTSRRLAADLEKQVSATLALAKSGARAKYRVRSNEEPGIQLGLRRAVGFHEMQGV